MTKYLWIAALVGGIAFASAHTALASQWKSDLDAVKVEPGAVAPTFTPFCAASMGGDSTAAEDEDCSNEAIAAWLMDWFALMDADQLDAILADLDPDGTLGMGGQDLIDANIEDILGLLEGLTDEQLGELCATKGAAKPCASTTMGACTVGRKCWGPCTDKNGKAGTCTWTSWVEVNPLFWSCPGGRVTHYVCTDPCPIPAWPLAIGALTATGAFLRRRRKLHVIAAN